MSSKAFLARNLAAAFLSGPWRLEDLIQAGGRACGRRPRWLRRLARRVLAAFEASATVACDQLADFIYRDRGFDQAWIRCQHEGRLPLNEVFREPAVPARWPVPSLSSPAALAEWLGLQPAELDWFADCHGRLARAAAGPLQHYTYRWVTGRRGKLRLLEMPKQRLKAIQRRLLREILEAIPIHDAVHGYRRGRSVVTYAAPHAGRDILLRFDLHDFFPSVPVPRVHALFRAAGYPATVARLLTGLCTNKVPQEALPAGPDRSADFDKRFKLHRQAHLPQGAPTSPALANLCTFPLDCRLERLARKLGACYTRYADDLAFSGIGSWNAAHDASKC